MWQEKSGANRCLVMELRSTIPCQKCLLFHPPPRNTGAGSTCCGLSPLPAASIPEIVSIIISRFGVGANCGHEKTRIEAVHIAHRNSVTTSPPHPALLAIGPIIETFLADKPNFLPSLSVFLAQLCFPDLMFHNKFMVK